MVKLLNLIQKKVCWNLHFGRYTCRAPWEDRIFFMAKVFTIPVPPKFGSKRRERTADPRYVDGQRLLVEAMKYLAQSDPVSNRSAIELISEHVRTRFRMSDSPLG